MAAFTRTCGLELKLLSRTKISYVSIINKQYREYARGYRRTPVRVLTADEEKQKFIDNKVAFRDRIQDVDRRDPVLNNLTQSNDLDQLKSLPRIHKAAVDNAMSYDLKGNSRPGRYTKNADWKHNPMRNIKDNVKSGGDTKKTQKKQITQSQQPYGKGSLNERRPVEEIIRNFSGVKYTVLGSKDKKVGVLMRAARSKKHREIDRTILLEGSRLIKDALQAGGTPKSIYFKEFDALQRLPKEYIQEVPIYKCDEKHMNNWSDIASVPDVMALFHMPEDGQVFVQPRTTIPLTIILDQIRDPGNMGTLIRSAAAVGCERIIAMQECVDLWEPKVLRSGTGCHFRVPFYRNITWNNVENYIPVGSRIYLADKRRPTDKRVGKYTDPEDDDNVIDTLGNDQNDYEDDLETNLISNTSFNDLEQVKQYKHAPLPVSSFSDMNYCKNDHTVLVIGGESYGVSLQAHKLAYDMYGQCIMIPMTNGVESVNAAVAGSVIMFEIFNQLHKPSPVENMSEPTGVSVSEDGTEYEAEPTGVSVSVDNTV
ncbi:rRNA methyltransferase 3, mitochondrial-like [Pecten maximus]|uniref:rRNA methyltransferase 3, mitochondrial-like n=1 Tax=Pecten maximus TaxID=6579 RepID=UPI001458765F|nr:rRNA methyltransferase 3, mitochondrial-like [Pecten maximus]